MNYLFVLTLIFTVNTSIKKLVEIPITSKSQVYEMNKLKVTIVSVTDQCIQIIADDDELRTLNNSGFSYTIIFNDYREPVKKLLEKGTYHTYETLVQELDSIAINYPAITKLDTIGYSVEGRPMLGLKISDNAETEETEPGIRFTGCHHGGELISAEIVLYLIKQLTDKYSTDSYIKQLVDGRQIWCVPIVNPDGMYSYSRYNANGVDLNRDYGYMWGWDSPYPFSQPESRALKLNAEMHSFTLGFDYHSVANIINCLWDYTPIRPNVDTIMLDLAKEYYDSASYIDTIMHGCDWYPVSGSCQDAMYGCNGIIDYTIETPQDADPIPVCVSNIGAMLKMIERSGDIGISGIITDSVTGNPINARIEIEGIDWPVYTNPYTGFYHIALLSGAYTLKISSNGYSSKEITNIIVDSSVTAIDVPLILNNKYYVNKLVTITYTGNSNKTLSPALLGPEDDKSFSIGTGGEVVLDMGIPIKDSFTVYEGIDSTGNEGYEVLVSNMWQDSFVSLGVGTGTTTFNISVTGLSEARYVKMIDDGNVSNYTTPGFDLDAIESYRAFGITEKNNYKPNIMICSNPVINNLAIKITNSNEKNITFKLYNLAGQLLIKDIISEGQPNFSISTDKIPSNIYFLKIEGRNWATTKKVIILH
ncbi:MAG: M14 family zinc carboxypeptidase [bacterium]|nr:M14 family zinc carboxypeptidase [bacterium]